MTTSKTRTEEILELKVRLAQLSLEEKELKEKLAKLVGYKKIEEGRDLTGLAKLVFSIIKDYPEGVSSVELIEEVEDYDAATTVAAIKTALSRLKSRNIIEASGKRGSYVYKLCQ